MTKISYHVSKIKEDNVLESCTDTNILITLLGNMDHFQSSIELSMRLGVGNNQRYLNVSQIYEISGV